MNVLKVLAAALFGAHSIASAQDVVLAGHVQRVVLQPSGTENCPPPCPLVSAHPDGSSTVCVSNQGGCQTMEIKIDRVYRGNAKPGETRQFKARIGEWGPSFPVTNKLIVVSEAAGRVSWSPVTEREGKIFIDLARLRRIGGVSTSPEDKNGLVALDEVLRRSSLP